MISRGNLRRDQAGQATLEAALTLPLLLLLLIGMVGVALILHASTVTMLAANRGARYAAVVYGDASLGPVEQEEKVRAAVAGVLGSGLNSTDYEIIVTPGDQEVTVNVTYRFRLALPWIRYLLGDDRWTTNHAATYRIEPQ